MNARDIEKTAFGTHEGHYEFLVLPFNKDLEEHLQHLETVESNYGCVPAPLTQLLKLGAFKWNEKAQLAFNKLKMAMMTLPVLAMPDFNLPFEIETDTSGYGFGAVLVQAKRPIAYFSHTLSRRDQAKPVYKRELIAVVLAVQRWRPYLLGLENKVADALSKVPPEAHLSHISTPALLDIAIIQAEMEKDQQLQEIKTKLAEQRNEASVFSLQQGWEVIMVVVDRMSKYAHFIALKHPYTARSIAEVFVKEIVKLHPRSIVSNRDRAEYWYNTTYHSSIGITPFQVVYGRLPPPLMYYGDMEIPNSTLEQQLKERDLALETLKEHLKLAQDKMKKCADLKRRELNSKLERWKVAYKLELPPPTSIHPVFHVSQLKKALGDHTKNPATREWEVLISWKGLPPHEATWEDCNDFNQQFPDFHLDDKVDLGRESIVRPPIIFKYSRRDKNVNTCANEEGNQREGDHIGGPTVREMD
ncbi:transposon Tf2-1 polyprotein isoform X1 [Cucumis melo var. makuwa]|uniref:Transposon Tf2-1 polyprotein isoform X1 n=1 Tax=Cucumis melo var. makuwa TaxID=1194695 RepID=A0A5D3D7N6_CUCMM|nr:transposon Tf2-1 polyprotein isoform X1 [Cucumis melo var. makuwa]